MFFACAQNIDKIDVIAIGDWNHPQRRNNQLKSNVILLKLNSFFLFSNTYLFRFDVQRGGSRDFFFHLLGKPVGEHQLHLTIVVDAVGDWNLAEVLQGARDAVGETRPDTSKGRTHTLRMTRNGSSGSFASFFKCSPTQYQDVRYTTV